MTQDEMKKIAEQSQKRTERDKLINKGTTVIFGDTEVIVKALAWDASNEFEDKVVEITQKLGFSSDLTKLKIADLVKNIVSIARDDMVTLANLATNGTVTIDFIKQHNAYKADLIDVIVEAFKCNYGYIKNLMALMPKG